MKIIISLILGTLIFFGFSFVNITFDISKWTDDARFFCVVLILVSFFGGCMLQYLNYENEKNR